ncbi:MAG: GNAT family N-acetyltransferase [Saprospiraceae bacterium]|nr:GNAT family N-acetyltransferase [Saprospiraceae bacterium]
MKNIHFFFPEMTASQRIYYEPLSEENYLQLPKLFAFDSSLYVLDRYKNEYGAKMVWEEYINYVKYSLKHCGHNWFMRLKDTNEYIGFLNLYDLNAELIDSREHRCTVGFQTAIPYRKLGFTKEGVSHLIAYAFKHFDIDFILAYTHKDNISSQSLLKNLILSPTTKTTTFLINTLFLNYREVQQDKVFLHLSIYV